MHLAWYFTVAYQ